MSKKQAFATLIKNVGAFKPLRALRNLTPQLQILAYHRVKDIHNPLKYDFDEELISASCEDFKWQVNHIKRHYCTMTLADAINHLNVGKKLSNKTIVITFDDGFDDNYHNAFKILHDAGLVATFFISTDYVNNPITFWFDLCAYYIKKAKPCGFSYQGFTLKIEGDIHARTAQIEKFLTFLKNISNSNRLKAISILGDITGVKIPDEGFVDSRPITWDQAREMHSAGMEIASHTVSHPILSKLNPDEIEYELKQSKKAIELNIQAECKTIAYPVGRQFAYTDRVIKTAKQAGYKAACSYDTGTNNTTKINHYQLKRTHVERYTTKELFEAQLACPVLFK